MHRSVLESIVGAVVLVIAAAFLFLGWRVAGPGGDGGYFISARFLQIGGLEPGSDVRINGIKVGTVVGRSLDPQTFEAVVRLSIAAGVKIPADSEATIVGDGLLGDKYVRLMPGTAGETLPAGGTIAKTRDYKTLEEAVSELIFLATGAN